uniref:Rae1 protein homolog n=1 Tax=Myotis myotis TaxID=51298 RepID=A0A7J7W062_MYOMY|nr:ribonucleic acid export 1 [Myotis myotis]
MSLFGTTSGFGTGGTSMFGSTTTDNHNPMKDIEVTSSPDDSIGCLSFSPPTLPGNFLIAGSWANDVRCWEVQDSGQTIPKAQQMHTGPVLDVCWSDDGSKVFTASCDKTAKMWDLNSNQAIQIAQHDAPVKTIHWIKAPNYSCVMTGSWDKTLKFWDTRSSNPMMVLQLPERCYCADMIYPMAVVATAERGLIVYQLENQPSEFRRIESPLKHQAPAHSLLRNAACLPRVTVQMCSCKSYPSCVVAACVRALDPVPSWGGRQGHRLASCGSSCPLSTYRPLSLFVNFFYSQK